MKDENLNAHLQSPDFFDAERHPEVSFTTEDVRRDGDKIEFDGEITIKGITQPATLTGTVNGPAVDHFGKNRVGLSLETTVDRTEFGINWNMPLPNGEPALANEVTLKADLTLVEGNVSNEGPSRESGSLRRESYNTSLLRALAEEAPAGSPSSSGRASSRSRPTTPTTT